MLTGLIVEKIKTGYFIEKQKISGQLQKVEEVLSSHCIKGVVFKRDADKHYVNSVSLPMKRAVQ